MAAIDSLRDKITSSASATELDAIITSEERALLLRENLGLLQPLPWLHTEARYFGIDNRGVLQAVNCTPQAIPEVWPYRAATDSEILAGLILAEAEHG